jgi:multiple sugar transport system permease protein
LNTVENESFATREKGWMAFAGRKLPQDVRRIPIGLLFIAPWIVSFLVFVVYPLFASLYYSFTFYPILKKPVWVGLENYQILFTDRLFKVAVRNTAYYAFFSVLSSTLLALILALLMNRDIWLRPLYRAILYTPTLVPSVSTAVLWVWMLDTRYGLVNLGLRALGLQTIPFFTSTAWSKPSLIFMGWWGVGGTMLVLLAALQDVPKSLYDAASIDGANAFQQTRYVTLPMITPALFFTLITGLIGAMQAFANVFFTTSGGPADSTLLYGLYIYNTAFGNLQMGYGCTLAWVLFAVIMLLTLLIFRSSEFWVFYSGAEGGA